MTDEKDENGAELLFPHTKEWIGYTESGREIVRRRSERLKRLDDELPKVAASYKEFLNA